MPIRGTDPDRREPWLAIVLVATLLAVAAPVTAEEQPSSAGARSCDAPEHRQLDFWLGDWEVVRADGELAGYNEISPVAGGCALLERWHGVRGGKGTSLTFYDPSTERWRQTWVGLRVILDLEGGWDGERMLLQGGPRRTPEGPVIDRIAWSPREDGEVLQVWEVSRDGGETWERVFAGLYRPRPGADGKEGPLRGGAEGRNWETGRRCRIRPDRNEARPHGAETKPDLA